MLKVVSEGQVTHMSVLSLNGKTLMEVSTSIIDVSALPSGLYLLKIEGAEGVGVTRFVKQ